MTDPTNVNKPIDSPHLRGCFHGIARRGRLTFRFPASAGVFPHRSTGSSGKSQIPRICGGVSVRRTLNSDFGRDSPHLRGCFSAHLPGHRGHARFPASAGVFPKKYASAMRPSPVPRICRGVSDRSIPVVAETLIPRACGVFEG